MRMTAADTKNATPVYRETLSVQVPRGPVLAVDWYPPLGAVITNRQAVFVHGLGSHKQGEKAVYLAGQFQKRGWGFLAPDLRGHGASGGSLPNLTMSGLLADLACSLNLLGTRGSPPVLIGSSMGAAVAGWHASRHPGSITALALIAPALGFPGTLLRFLPPPEQERWRREGRLALRNQWIDVELGEGLLEEADTFTSTGLRNTLSAPALLIHGMQDDSVPWRDSLEFVEQAQAREMSLHLIREGDHRLTAHKEFLFELIWCWLETQDGVSA